VISDVTAKEGNSGTTAFRFTVSVNGPTMDPVTVQYATANGTATAPIDYLPIPLNTATIAAGQTSTTVTVAVVGDIVRERNETFYVNLSSPSPNAYLGDGQGVGTIVNDD
jgi:large repetitive protein